MVFSSLEFLYLFLPLTWVGFLLLMKTDWGRVAIAWLTIASFVFYGIWRPQDLPILAGSALFNYLVSRKVAGTSRVSSAWFFTAIAPNLALLFWFKYSAFASEVLVASGVLQQAITKHVLPLGISFFTFTQIAYQVDRRRGLAPSSGLLNYLLFVTYFPHLMAGPIIHHKEMMPQFDAPAINWENIARGIFVLSIGLFKKVVIADSLAPLVDWGFGGAESLPMLRAWAVVIAYTLQLYFDFSGYSDMAVGASLLFGIRLPWNFLSPYKASNISEFWRTWHITLSRFLRDYVYIPLGGSRATPSRTAVNLLITMLIGGIWHGAGWTFVIWGALHGVALAVYHLVKNKLPHINYWVGWIATQSIVVFGWVLFRAGSLTTAKQMYAAMLGMGNSGLLRVDDQLLRAAPILVAGAVIALFAPNSAELEARLKPSPRWVLATGAIQLAALLVVVSQFSAPEFLYYDF